MQVLDYERDFILDPSLVLYLPLWKKDGAQIMSEDRYGHPCTVTGANWTPQGRYFDGVDDKIIVPDHPAMDWTSELTVLVFANLWVEEQFKFLISKYNPTGNKREWAIIVGPDAADYYFSVTFGDPADGTYETRVITDNPLTISGYHLLGFVFDSGTVDLYQDTNIVPSSGGGVPATLYNSTAQLSIASSNEGSGGFGNQYIHTALIYKRALSSPIINNIYVALKETLR